MTADGGTLQQDVSMKAFGLGIGVVALAYALLLGYLWFKGPETLDRRAEKLASQTVLIEREEYHEMFGPPAPETTPEPTIETPAETHSNPVLTMAPVTESDEASLVRAPIEGLYEDTLNGRLPIIRSMDKLTPFEAYRRPFTPVAGKPTVSVVVMDIGISDTASKAVMSEISPDVSVIVSPYATETDFWISEARIKGHEVWLKLPVEPELYPMDDSGPQTLLVNALEKQNYNKLVWAMTRGTGYAGFVTGGESSFMKSANDVRPVIAEIYKRGLGFVDGDTKPSEIPASMATGLNAPYASNDVWIDVPATPEHISASLRQLEVLSQGQGSAIGFIHSTPTGLKMLQTWIDGLPQKGIVLAPLSAQTQKVK
jgi:polysaccharide deacetylase 2 family uncharacterized protein YibQ